MEDKIDETANIGSRGIIVLNTIFGIDSQRPLLYGTFKDSNTFPFHHPKNTNSVSDNMGKSIVGVHIDPSIKLPPIKERNSLVRLLNRFICHNQGRYIEFEFLLGSRHKKLKESLKNGDPNAETVYNNCKELLRFITRELEAITKENFSTMVEYFSLVKKSKWPPRICVKGMTENQIADLHRSRRGAYYVPPHPIESNTGFEKVSREGIWYIENDIPGKAREGFYKNPRIIDRNARNYKRPFSTWFSKDATDHAWISCWKNDDDGSEAKVESCYKSTMIIPMTLIRNQLSDEFARMFFDDRFPRDRAIWGFLCFDHTNLNYFDEDTDRRMGYIFADILSLYYVSSFIHTQISETFCKSIEFCGKEPREWGKISWNPEG